MMKKEKKDKEKITYQGISCMILIYRIWRHIQRISRLSLRCKDECEDKNKKLDVNRCKLDNYIIIEKNSEWKKY